MPEGRVLTLSEESLECWVRIELEDGDCDTGMSGGEGNDRSALHGGLHAANALP